MFASKNWSRRSVRLLYLTHCYTLYMACILYWKYKFSCGSVRGGSLCQECRVGLKRDFTKYIFTRGTKSGRPPKGP